MASGAGGTNSKYDGEAETEFDTGAGDTNMGSIGEPSADAGGVESASASLAAKPGVSSIWLCGEVTPAEVGTRSVRLPCLTSEPFPLSRAFSEQSLSARIRPRDGKSDGGRTGLTSIDAFVGTAGSGVLGGAGAGLRT